MFISGVIGVVFSIQPFGILPVALDSADIGDWAESIQGSFIGDDHPFGGDIFHPDGVVFSFGSRFGLGVGDCDGFCGTFRITFHPSQAFPKG
jgi:hypothetical protein